MLDRYATPHIKWTFPKCHIGTVHRVWGVDRIGSRAEHT